MSEELRACPFCGSKAVVHESQYGGGNWLECENRQCIGNSIVGIYSQWQKRPLEDALAAERDLLRAQLEVAMKALDSIGNADRNDEGVYGQLADDALAEIAKLGEKK